jgi:DNA-binding GntR family transcriptional regulator
MMIKLPRRSVQDEIYDALRQDILNLNLSPGSALSESEISLKFEVSRTPVREAFIHLAREDLLHIVPQKGSFVSLIDLNRVEQEFFLRESLELAVLEPFLEKCSASDLETLEREIAVQQDAFEKGDYLALISSDDDFHRIFYQVSGLDLCWDVLSGHNSHYRRARLLSIWFKGIAVNLPAQHRGLLDALKQHDLAAARRSLIQHIRKIEVEEGLLLSEFPGFFVSVKRP